MFETTPRTSFVYLFRADGGFYKIGQSESPQRRVADFAHLPFNVELVHKIATDDPGWLEGIFHKTHQHCRVQGEWFKLTAAEVELFVQSTACLRSNLLEKFVPPEPWVPPEPPIRMTTVKVDHALIRKAKMVAIDRRVKLQEYLDGLLRAGIERDYDLFVEDCTSSPDPE